MALADVPPALVQRCRTGDAGAFDELFAMIHQDVFRWFYSLLRDEDDAQEAMQECFIRMFRHLKSLSDDAKFASWLGRMIVNQANTFRTKRTKTRFEELAPEVEVENEQLPIQGRGGADPRTAAERAEVFARVNEAIRELPPRQRTAVLSFDVQGMSIAEIARSLGCSEGAVKFNIFQGRRKLREALSDLGQEQLPGVLKRA